MQTDFLYVEPQLGHAPHSGIERRSHAQFKHAQSPMHSKIAVSLLVRTSTPIETAMIAAAGNTQPTQLCVSKKTPNMMTAPTGIAVAITWYIPRITAGGVKVLSSGLSQPIFFHCQSTSNSALSYITPHSGQTPAKGRSASAYEHLMQRACGLCAG